MERKTLQRRFGRVVRTHRAALDLSQEDLAFEAGLHRTYVSLLERGLRNPSLYILWKLSRGLGVSLPSLLEELEPHRRTH